jgi:hypothetical protein
LSADNWAECPRCKVRHLAKVEAAKKAAAAAYGTVSVEEWRELEAAVEELRHNHPETTFREDYEIYGADEGVLKISYSGNCGVCNLDFQISQSHPIPGIND